MLTESQIREILADADSTVDWATEDKNSRFEDRGLDSLDRFDVLVRLQEKTGIEVPDDDVEKLQSIAEIEAYFIDK